MASATAPSPSGATVLLTGGGGAALPALITRLRARGHRVLVVDADPHAAGLYLADRGFRIPLASDPAFPEALRRILRAESVHALVPLVDEELLPAARVAGEEEIALIAPRPEFTALCLDKHALMRRLAEVGLPAPPTRLLSEGWEGLPFPLILKPRVGRGSRGVFVARSPEALRAQLMETPRDGASTLVQPFVEGTEYTVSVVAWRDGRVRAVVPKEVVDKRGITRIAITRRHAGIDRLGREIQRRLAPDGPFNVQLRVAAATGDLVPFEINPRFSTTVTLTQEAGVDEVGGLVDLAIGRGEPSADWPWREGVTLIRRTLDAFLDVGEYERRRAGLEQAP